MIKPAIVTSVVLIIACCFACGDTTPTPSIDAGALPACGDACGSAAYCTREGVCRCGDGSAMITCQRQ